MNQTISTAATRRAKQEASKQRYAPRAVVKQAVKVAGPLEIKMRRLTASVLDELKRPDAIPSNIILAALMSARGL